MALVPISPPVPDPSRRPAPRAGTRPMRVVDPEARARLDALASRLGGTVAGLGRSGATTGTATGNGGAGITGAGVGGGVLAAERVVPVHPALERVLPRGLVQGTTVACAGGAATSMALLVAAEASRRGAWVGVAGLPGLGVQAAGEAGVDVERLVAVLDRPGADRDDGTWGQVLAALVDGFDLVVIGPGVVVRTGTARRVQARVQARGAVLVLAGEVPGFGADLQVVTEPSWEGLGQGHGHLRSRRTSVRVHGRRVPRPQHDELWFPASDGRITAVHPAPVAAVPAPEVVPAAHVLERTG